MLTTIDLNYQSLFETYKINNVILYGLLPAEFNSIYLHTA